MRMSFELTMLATASFWGFVQLVAAAQAANVQYGLSWAASPRDAEMPPLKPIPGRINRNFRNYMETFPFFVAAVLAAEAASVHNELTHWGSIAYIGGRIAYTGLYGPAYRSSARCSGTSQPSACLQFWRRLSCLTDARAQAADGHRLQQMRAKTRRTL